MSATRSAGIHLAALDLRLHMFFELSPLSLLLPPAHFLCLSSHPSFLLLSFSLSCSPHIFICNASPTPCHKPYIPHIANCRLQQKNHHRTIHNYIRIYTYTHTHIYTILPPSSETNVPSPEAPTRASGWDRSSAMDILPIKGPPLPAPAPNLPSLCASLKAASSLF